MSTVQLILAVYWLACMWLGTFLIESCTELFYRRTWFRVSLGAMFILIAPLWLTPLVALYLIFMGIFFMFLPIAQWRARRRRSRAF